MADRSEFMDLIYPQGERLSKLYDIQTPPTNQPRNDAADPARAIPQGLIDALTVRETVFVQGQNVPWAEELDEDDPRSFHWTAYASVRRDFSAADDSGPNNAANGKRRASSTSTKMPIGTIRLVPPPHKPHPNGKTETDVHKNNESYIKLGRLAVIPEYRGMGVADILIGKAVEFVIKNPDQIIPRYEAGRLESLKHTGAGVDYKGLLLVHSQVGVQKVWKRHGFETDESMGTWDEVGIDHVGMWKRVDCSKARKKSLQWGTSSRP